MSSPTHALRAAALVALLSACADDAAQPAAPPEDAAFAALAGGPAVELLPLAPIVSARCPQELLRTYCSRADALAAAHACRARLTDAERARCDSARGCVAPYAPARPGACADGPTYPAPEACAAPVDDSCAFYRGCLDAAHPCGDAGYALGFGEPLCYLFIDRRDEFTPAGQRWLRSVRTCLQRALAPLAARPAASCDALANDAYASHAGCYTAPESSFCALPPSDVLRLANLLGPYLADPRAMAQTRAVAWFCARHTGANGRRPTTLLSARTPAPQPFWEGLALALTDDASLQTFLRDAR